MQENYRFSGTVEALPGELESGISYLPNMNYLQKRIQSFGYAFKGIGTLIRTQPHATVHALATVMVIGTGFLIEVNRMEWVALAFAIGIVWISEAVNTAIEFLTDLVSPGHHPLAGKVKDIAAAAVLLAAVLAVVIAAIVFVPYLTGTYP